MNEATKPIDLAVYESTKIWERKYMNLKKKSDVVLQ